MKTLDQFRQSRIALNEEHLSLSRIDRGPYTFLRAANLPGSIRTSRDDWASEREFRRVHLFARRAKAAREARRGTVRIQGVIREMSATHEGDVRVGCSLISWAELSRMYELVQQG